MPRNARVVLQGIPYHVTQRGTNRQRVFECIGDRKLYLQLIRETREEAGVKVLAYCLMTNHIHLVVVPEREDSLAILFGRAHGRYAQAWNIRHGRSGHVWQARFSSCPMSPSHLEAALLYVERNPCRAGMAAKPEDYRWSSAAAHLLGTKDGSGILDLEFWQEWGGVEGWQRLHARRVEEAESRRLQKCTYAGRPFGEEAFIRDMEERFQRKWLRSARNASPKRNAAPAANSGVSLELF